MKENLTCSPVPQGTAKEYFLDAAKQDTEEKNWPRSPHHATPIPTAWVSQEISSHKFKVILAY